MIQLFANSTRAVTLRGEADWEVLRPYLAPVLPVSVAGYLLADGVPEDGGRAVIGVFALVAVWWPAATNWLAPSPGRGIASPWSVPERPSAADDRGDGPTVVTGVQGRDP